MSCDVSSAANHREKTVLKLANLQCKIGKLFPEKRQLPGRFSILEQDYMCRSVFHPGTRYKMLQHACMTNHGTLAR